jgi:site-specific DNA recombinase
MSDGQKTALVYLRVSGDEQAKKGFSLPDQLGACRAWCAENGYRVVEVVEDGGYSGAVLVRPGLDRLRERVAAGGVDAVVVLFRDRLARGILASLLQEEFARAGTRLVALNAQTEDTPEGDLHAGILDVISGWERKKIRERTQRGLAQKVRSGRVIRGSKPPYGFTYDEDDGGALLPHPPEAEVLRRIFSHVAEGGSMHSACAGLNRDRVPTPGGAATWNKTTIRNLLLSPLYRPLSAAEVAQGSLVAPDVAAALDPGGTFGLWAWNKRKTTREKVAEAGPEGVCYRNRYTVERRDPSEWMHAPVEIGSLGLERAVVDLARAAVEDRRRRKPATGGGRFFELSGGIGRCQECGATLSPRTTRSRNKDGTERTYYYYCCPSRYNSPPRECASRKSFPARDLEARVFAALIDFVNDKELMEREINARIDAELRVLRHAPDASAVAERLERLERKRERLWDLAADGDMPKHVMRRKVEEVEAAMGELRAELAGAANVAERVEDLEFERRLLLAGLDYREQTSGRGGSGWWPTLPGEETHQKYNQLGITVHVDRHGNATIRGAVGTEIGVSSSASTGWSASRRSRPTPPGPPTSAATTT